MSSIYYAMIIFPIIFLATLLFIFSSSLASVNNQQFLMNCPFPVNSGIATLNSIANNQLNYTITYDNATSDYHLTLINCYIDNGSQGANTVVYTESATNWFGIGNGYLAYFSNTISQIGLKVQAFFTTIYLFFNAPAEVTGLEFFTYINVILISFIGLGAFMVVRG